MLEVLHLGGYIDLSVRQYIAVVTWRLQIPERVPSELIVREVTVAERNLLVALQPDKAAICRSRFANGQRCLAAFLGGRCVAWLWLAFGPTLLRSSFGCIWEVPPETVWLFDVYSDAGVLGVVPHLYAHLRRNLDGRKYHRLAGQIEYDNLRSRGLHRSLGYEETATLCSLRWRSRHVHLSRTQRNKRWRWHVGCVPVALGENLIPSERGGAICERSVPSTTSNGANQKPEESRSRLIYGRCRCGLGVPLVGTHYVCECGRDVGYLRSGVAIVGKPTAYWGEISRQQMKRLLALAEEGDWRRAVVELTPGSLGRYIESPVRAAFEDVLPISPNSRVLDVGAGWGGIAAGLAKRYDVVALEGVCERAQFIAMRARQDGLERLSVVNADLSCDPLQHGQFDAIVANGVLEWVALADVDARPEDAQLKVLQRLRQLLTPGGVVYLAIENRVGWAEWRGALDHSGLPYTSLLPRPVARWVCSRSRTYRSQFNVGYRTYTYSHAGYLRLFARAGLEHVATWIAPEGYNRPRYMVPPCTPAIQLIRQRVRASQRWRDRAIAVLRKPVDRSWFWRRFGSDYAFLLAAQGDGFGSPQHLERLHE